MSVWFCIPSARPNGGTAPLWRDRGYKVALFLDPGAAVPAACDAALSADTYPGYARAVNALAAHVLASDPSCSWIVAGGDDTEPDPTHTPEDIAAQCGRWFRGTFGVMQPTGDRFANGSIDKIAGSPWLGRRFCERMYGGKGPLFEGYQHMFVDEELLEVAEKLGVYWRRPDLVHLHHHFMRESAALSSRAVSKPVPAHLKQWNSRSHWDESKALFLLRKAAGFPGHEPIPVEVFA